MIRFRLYDIPGLVFVVLAVAGLVYLAFAYPNRKMPTPLGPEWQCSGTARSPDFCIKKPAPRGPSTGIGRLSAWPLSFVRRTYLDASIAMAALSNWGASEDLIAHNPNANDQPN